MNVKLIVLGFVVEIRFLGLDLSDKVEMVLSGKCMLVNFCILGLLD